MKITALLKCYTFTLVIMALSCTRTEKSTPPLNSAARQDSIKNDEKNFPIAHHHLVFNKRAVIRPIYVETIENMKAIHKGYLIHIELANKAKTTSYKDIKLEITYFSKQDVALDKETISINKLVKPGSTLKISKKVLRYKNSSYKVQLLSANSAIL